MKDFFKKQIAFPQDHGSWVFILSPLFIGIFSGQSPTIGTFNLIVASIFAFMMRQPMTVFLKATAGRRPKTDLVPACSWALIYGSIVSLALLGIYLEGNGYIFSLALPGILIFAWHLWLTGKREERKQAGVEIIAAGTLALIAPAAYWVSLGIYQPYGWWLWALVWLQSGASIVYAYLRLEQREQAQIPARSEQMRIGRGAFAFTSFNLAASLMLGWGNLIPQLIFIPFLIQWLETIWGITHPSIGWRPARVGFRQLIVSTIWTILFIIFWRVS